jgi:hypothetical protein
MSAPVLDVDKRKEEQVAPPQVRLLTRLIESDPTVPVHYLLRGEEWLVCGQFDRARQDFETARAQAEALLAESIWGYIYQAYVDRAETGLRQCNSNF